LPRVQNRHVWLGVLVDDMFFEGKVSLIDQKWNKSTQYKREWRIELGNWADLPLKKKVWVVKRFWCVKKQNNTLKFRRKRGENFDDSQVKIVFFTNDGLLLKLHLNDELTRQKKTERILAESPIQNEGNRRFDNFWFQCLE
jgi:hypothetical protein